MSGRLRYHRPYDGYEPPDLCIHGEDVDVPCWDCRQNAQRILELREEVIAAAKRSVQVAQDGPRHHHALLAAGEALHDAVNALLAAEMPTVKPDPNDNEPDWTQD